MPNRNRWLVFPNFPPTNPQNPEFRSKISDDHANQPPKLLAILAELCGELLNLSQVGAPIGMDGKTVDKYIGILEKLFLVRRLPAFSRNTLSRLIKSLKVHFKTPRALRAFNFLR